MLDEQVAASETQCTAFTITEPTPIERALTGCGQTVTYMIGCNVAACAWGHMASSGGAAPVATAPPTTTVATASATATIDPQSQLMTIASDRWTRAQACLNGQHIDATLTLSLDGHVSASLDAPLHGTAVEACVQAAVADVTLAMTGATAPVSVMLTL